LEADKTFDQQKIRYEYYKLKPIPKQSILYKFKYYVTIITIGKHFTLKIINDM